MFGMLKQEIKGQVFHTFEDKIAAVQKTWGELTLEEPEFLFFNLLQRLEYIIEYIREYCTN
jgi:hypothetical protein